MIISGINVVKLFHDRFRRHAEEPATSEDRHRRLEGGSGHKDQRTAKAEGPRFEIGQTSLREGRPAGRSASVLDYSGRPRGHQGSPADPRASQAANWSSTARRWSAQQHFPIAGLHARHTKAGPERRGVAPGTPGNCQGQQPSGVLPLQGGQNPANGGPSRSRPAWVHMAEGFV